jgi:hypothetical protein
MRRLIWPILAAAGLAACETPTTMAPTVTATDTAAEAERQYQYVLETRLAERARVNDVGFRLFRANAELCPARRGLVGLAVGSVSQFNAPYHEAAVRMFGSADALVVLHVASGSPAALAGIRDKDQIVALNGSPVPTGPDAPRSFSEAVTQTIQRGGRPTLVIRHGGQEQTITVESVPGCDYSAVVEDGDDLNAYADGRAIHITRAMLRIASTDQELALVMAHELAHDARKHVQAESKNRTLAGLGGALIDAYAASRGINTGGRFTRRAQQLGASYAKPEFEAEADYVGMYFMARANFQVDGVETFWRKMAAEEPQAIYVMTDHPPIASRYVAIEETAAEIARKRAAGEPLIPNERPK